MFNKNNNSAFRVNTDLLPAVLFQTVEQLVHVGEPERQQLKVVFVTLKYKLSHFA